MRRGWLLLILASVTLALFAGCGTILGIEDFTPGSDGGTDGAGSRSDARPDREIGPDSASDASQSDGESRSDGKSSGDARSDRETRSDGSVDEGVEMDAELDGQVDAGPDDAKVAADRDVADSGGSVADAGDAACTPKGNADSGVPGTLNWAENFGMSGSSNVSGVALDPTSGAIAVAGNFLGTLDFDAGVLSSGGDAGATGTSGAFVVKLDSGGHYQWARAFGSDEAVVAGAVAVDGSGNVAIGGNLSGTSNLGTTTEMTSYGFTDIFLAKYSSAGVQAWSHHYGSAGSLLNFRQAAVDSAGDLYVVGELGGGALDLGGGCAAIASGMAMFVAEFSPGGACVWSHGYGPYDMSNSYTDSETIAYDPTGNVLVAGGFFGTMDLGKGTMTAPGVGNAAFIQKFSSDGELSWVKDFGAGNGAAVTGIAADTCGDIWIDGGFSISIDFGGGTTVLTESEPQLVGDIFLAKLDPSGVGIWSNSFGDGFTDNAGPIALDRSGGPVITGSFVSNDMVMESATLNFGNGILYSNVDGFYSMYIAKFDSAGTCEWAYAGGALDTDMGTYGGGLAANGNVVVTVGDLGPGTLRLAGTSLTAMSQQDTYVASFVH